MIKSFACFGILISTSGHKLSHEDLDTIRAHNVKVTCSLGHNTWNLLLRGLPDQMGNMPSEQRLQTRITFLSGITPYDMTAASALAAATLAVRVRSHTALTATSRASTALALHAKHLPTYPSSLAS